MEVDHNMVGCIIAVIVGIGVIVDFIVCLGMITRSSARAAFDRERADREQIEAIREYNRRKAEKERKIAEMKNR